MIPDAGICGIGPGETGDEVEEEADGFRTIGLIAECGKLL